MNGNSQKYKEILESPTKKLCVIAGPGSGKTKGLLIPKAEQIISNQSVDPDEMLVISFSRLSAQDLKERVKKLDRVPRASTLHSICLSFLLSEDNHDIRKRVDSIVIDFEKKIILSDLKLIFPNIDKRKLKRMLDEFSAGWAIRPHDEVFSEDEDKKKFKTAVLNWLDEHEAAMMEEIVYHAVDLAKKLKTDFIDRPQYIFIDEFQDLNKLEQEFIALLGADSKLMFVVGDPNQSIYSFKYAHPEGIEHFAKSEDVEDHTLEYSGRCSKKIIKIANQLLGQVNPARSDFLKPLTSAIDGEALLVQKNRQNDEYSFVLNSITERLKNGVDPKDIIVLVPRKKLGLEFVKHTQTQQLPNDVCLRFIVKNEYSELEQEKILLLGIIAHPNSILRIRTFVGLKDKNNFSNEFEQLKGKYGNIKEAILKADPNDFDKRNKKLRSLCSQLQQIREFVHCFEGEINLTFHKKYLHKELDGNTPMIKGAAVQKWFITPEMSQGEIEYIDADSYLRENQSPKSKHFEKERIVMQGITGVDEKTRLKMTIIDSGTFCGNSVNYIVFRTNSVPKEYLLALLNSSLLNWYFKAFSTNSNVNGYEVDNLPIPITIQNKQKPFIGLVNKIFAITKDDDYLENSSKQAKVRDYEKQIDQMVYKLYGLTKEEIKIVENARDL